MDFIEQILTEACNYQAISQLARDKAREEYKKNETAEENSIRISIDGLIAMVLKETNNIIKKTNNETSFQLLTITSYVRTHFIISDLILDGDLVEAAILIRKQLEALARLNELDSRPLEKLLGKTPNIQNALNGSSKKIYGILSEVAHSSSHRVAELLTIVDSEDRTGPLTIPVYSMHSHAAWDMITLINFYFYFFVLKKLENWYPELNIANYKEVFHSTFRLAVENDIISLDKEAVKE